MDILTHECVMSSTAARASAEVVTLEGSIVRVFSSAEAGGRITGTGG